MSMEAGLLYLLAPFGFSLSVYPVISVSVFLFSSCVHSTPPKAGLHVLASDWLQSKKVMSFLVGRCVALRMRRGERIEGRDPASEQQTE